MKTQLKPIGYMINNDIDNLRLNFHYEERYLMSTGITKELMEALWTYLSNNASIPINVSIPIDIKQ